MSDNQRDTQFAGFAKTLFEDIWSVADVFVETTNPHWYQDIQQAIARRAYDLVKHAEECWDHRGKESMDDVSDMPELPEEK